MIVLDANVLLRIVDLKSPTYAATFAAVAKKRSTDSLAMVDQTLYEFCAVATRDPSYNGLGMDCEAADRWINRFRRMFILLPEPPDLIDRWQSLVRTHGIKGFRVHDARYVAAMQGLGVSEFMTHNVQHFKVFPIVCVDPMMV